MRQSVGLFGYFANYLQIKRLSVVKIFIWQKNARIA
jgi:hypothetical protein